MGIKNNSWRRLLGLNEKLNISKYTGWKTKWSTEINEKTFMIKLLQDPHLEKAPSILHDALNQNSNFINTVYNQHFLVLLITEMMINKHANKKEPVKNLIFNWRIFRNQFYLYLVLILCYLYQFKVTTIIKLFTVDHLCYYEIYSRL